DDGDPRRTRIRRANVDARTDRVALGPVCPRHRLVDDDHGRRGRCIGRREGAPRYEWNAQRAEVVLRCDHGEDERRGPIRGPRRILYEQPVAVPPFRGRKLRRHRDARYAGQRAQRPIEVVEELILRRDRTIAAGWRIELEGEQTIRIEADWRARHRDEAADEESRGREKTDGKRELRGDEHSAHATRTDALARAACLVAQRPLWIRTAGGQRGARAEDEAGHEREH